MDCRPKVIVQTPRKARRLSSRLEDSEEEEADNDEEEEEEESEQEEEEEDESEEEEEVEEEVEDERWSCCSFVVNWLLLDSVSVWKKDMLKLGAVHCSNLYCWVNI